MAMKAMYVLLHTYVVLRKKGWMTMRLVEGGGNERQPSYVRGHFGPRRLVSFGGQTGWVVPRSLAAVERNGQGRERERE